MQRSGLESKNSARAVVANQRSAEQAASAARRRRRARRHHSQMIRPVQVAEAIIVLVILFSLFKVVTVEV